MPTMTTKTTKAMKTTKVIPTTVTTRRNGTKTYRFGNWKCPNCSCGEGNHMMAAMASRGEHCICGKCPGKDVVVP